MLNSKSVGHATKNLSKITKEMPMKNTRGVEGGKLVVENYRSGGKRKPSTHTTDKEVMKKRYDAHEWGGPKRKLSKHASRSYVSEKEISAASTSEFSPIISSVVSLAGGMPMRISNTRDPILPRKVTAKMINNVISGMSSKLSSVGHMCLSVGSVGESMKGKSYVQVLGHFHDYISLQSVSLGVIEIGDSIQVESVTQSLAGICEKWKISPEKVTAVVSDFNYSMNEAVRRVFGKNRLLYCFTKQINRIALKFVGDKVVKETLCIVKNIWSFLKDSQEGISELTNSEEISLKTLESQSDNWVSDYKLLEKYLQYSEGKFGVFRPRKIMNTDELTIAKDIYVLLKFLISIITELNQERKMYCSEVIPVVWQLKKNVSKFSPLSTEGKSLKQKFECIITEKFQFVEFAHFLSISNLLDPRFKGLYFENSQAYHEAERHIMNILKHKTGNPILENLCGASCNSRWESHDAMFSRKSELGNSSEELKHFLNEPVLKRTDTDPIWYWIQNATRFPNLWRVADKYLCVPGTSVPPMNINLKPGVKFGGKGGKARLEKLLFLKSLPTHYLESHA